MKTIITKSLLTLLITFILNLSLCVPCYADKGIFNPKVDPDEVFITDMPAVITIFAEIGDVPMNDIKVSINETTKEGHTLKTLCEMNLDISLGLFSGQFTINEKMESTFYFKIFAYYNSQGTFESSILKVDIFEPLPEGIIVDLSADLKALENNFIEYLKSNDLLTARQMVLNDAKKNRNITSASLNGHTLSIIYKKKVNGIVFLYDPKN
jgi:hypothetical protein